MDLYKRQIAYLYMYKHGIRAGNSGFVKAETRKEKCRLEIHLKSLCHPGEETGKAYIYFYYNHRMIGIYLGTLEDQNGTLEWQGIVNPENIQDKGIHICETKGIWIRRAKGQDYIAEWNDLSVDVSSFILYPEGGEKCIRCPRFGICKRSRENASDRR